MRFVGGRSSLFATVALSVILMGGAYVLAQPAATAAGEVCEVWSGGTLVGAYGDIGDGVAQWADNNGSTLKLLSDAEYNSTLSLAGAEGDRLELYIDPNGHIFTILTTDMNALEAEHVDIHLDGASGGAFNIVVKDAYGEEYQPAVFPSKVAVTAVDSHITVTDITMNGLVDGSEGSWHLLVKAESSVLAVLGDITVCRTPNPDMDPEDPWYYDYESNCNIAEIEDTTLTVGGDIVTAGDGISPGRGTAFIGQGCTVSVMGKIETSASGLYEGSAGVEIDSDSTFTHEGDLDTSIGVKEGAENVTILYPNGLNVSYPSNWRSIRFSGSGVNAVIDGNVVTHQNPNSGDEHFRIIATNGARVTINGDVLGGRLIAEKGGVITVNGNVNVEYLYNIYYSAHLFPVTASNGGAINITGDVTSRGLEGTAVPIGVAGTTGAAAFGGTVNIGGDVKVYGKAPIGVEAASTSVFDYGEWDYTYYNGAVNVGGSVTAVGEDSVGVKSHREFWDSEQTATVTVEGDVVSDGYAVYGYDSGYVKVSGDAESLGSDALFVTDGVVYILGDVRAANGAGVHSTAEAEVKIDGAITAEDYMSFSYESYNSGYNAEYYNVTLNEGEYEREDGGYFIYEQARYYLDVTDTWTPMMDSFSVVMVKVPSATAVLDGISISGPAKTAYTAGEALDLAGLTVTAAYSDATTAVVTAYATSPAAGSVLNAVGTTNVQVSYTEDSITKTASFAVTVSAPPATLDGISLSGPTKTAYTAGEALDLAGLTVTAAYSDTSTAVVTAYATSPAAGSVLNAVGTTNVQVSYTEDSITKTASFAVTVNAPTPPSPPQMIPVTGVSLNNNSMVLAEGGNRYVTATVTPLNAANKAVAWHSDNTSVAVVSSNGLVTAIGPGTAAITVTTADGGFTAVCTVTVKESSYEAHIEPEATTDENGVVATVTADQAEDALGQIGNGGTVSINVPSDGPVTVNIQSSGLKSMADAGAEVKVVTGAGTIVLDSEAVSSISGDGDVSIHISVVDVHDLNEAQKEMVGDSLVVEISVMSTDGVPVQIKGTATVTIPYEVEEGRDPTLIKVWYIDSEGNIEEYPCTYDPVSKTVTFVTTHFSYYAVVYTGTDEGEGTGTLLYAVAVAALLVAALAGAAVYARSRRESGV